MKIKEWIIWGLFAITATASTGLGAEMGSASVQENFANLEKAIQATKEQVNVNAQGKTFRWAELENFQKSLWRAMALDPTPIYAVPVNQVPKNLFAAELNEDLVRQIQELKKSPHPKEFKAETEFNQYIQTADNILAMRKSRQFPQARAIAKRGVLENYYQPLHEKINSESGKASIDSVVPGLYQATELTRTLREQFEGATKAPLRKDAFNNGNQFIWFMMAIFFGFFLGVFGYRMSPDVFQKILDYFDSSAPAATTHSSGTKLDYARWLKEFEEILSRLKLTQQSHERRIEDIVQNSEKIAQHSLSLFADARVKNDINLEYRMCALVQEIQSQFDQSQKLQAGDRVQVNLMLEHCLNLCEAIEHERVHVDPKKLMEAALFNQAG